MLENSVTFIGGGSFGTALAVMLAKKGLNVSIWDRNKAVIQDINEKRENIKYLSNIVIPSNVEAFSELDKAIGNNKFIVLSVPSHVIRTICKTIKPYINDDCIIINIAKGIEEETSKRLSTVIKEELPNNPMVTLSGPSHAEEVALDIPTAVVVSSENMEYAKRVQELFMTSKFRVYVNDDMIGIEICGAVKNIIAFAAGISDGIGYGDNTKAALMTRGMNEIVRIGEKLGGRRETLWGLTGVGDMIVTCTSMHSRNRRAGILVGKGLSMDEAVKEVGMVVEGIKACKAFYYLKEKLNISMPITDALYRVLFEGENPKYCVYELMTRDKKHELY